MTDDPLSLRGSVWSIVIARERRHPAERGAARPKQSPALAPSNSLSPSLPLSQGIASPPLAARKDR